MKGCADCKLKNSCAVEVCPEKLDAMVMVLVKEKKAEA